MIRTENKPIFYPQGCVVAMGTFDGVHKGHQAVINCAKTYDLPIAVVTTADNPHGLPRLLSHEQCEQAFEGLGVDAIVYLSFADIRHMSPEEYLDYLRQSMNTKAFCCGFNFHLGKNAQGNVDTIRQYTEQHGLSCAIAEQVEHVSSTEIRRCLQAGEVEKANQKLGRAYAIDFAVSHGDGRGHALSFPTVNQEFPDGFCVPKLGVYASKTLVDGKWYPSVSNIGIRPTYPLDKPRCETYLIGFEGNVYEKKVLVELTSYLREERKFDSAEQLQAQIKADIQQALQ